MGFETTLAKPGRPPAPQEPFPFEGKGKHGKGEMPVAAVPPPPMVDGKGKSVLRMDEMEMEPKGPPGKSSSRNSHSSLTA